MSIKETAAFCAILTAFTIGALAPWNDPAPKEEVAEMPSASVIATEAVNTMSACGKRHLIVAQFPDGTTAVMELPTWTEMEAMAMTVTQDPEAARALIVAELTKVVDALLEAGAVTIQLAHYPPDPSAGA